jgi:hypothetical protein
VDFIILSPAQGLVLVECKAQRLRAAARRGERRDEQAGRTGLEDDVDRTLSKAQKQIERTAKLIRDGHSAFSDLPRDSKQFGLIVTLEPFHYCLPDVVVNSYGAHTLSWVTPIQTLEALVCVNDKSVIEVLETAPTNQHGLGIDLDRHLQRLPRGRNCILDEAWSRYPFQAVYDDQGGD